MRRTVMRGDLHDHGRLALNPTCSNSTTITPLISCDLNVVATIQLWIRGVRYLVLGIVAADAIGEVELRDANVGPVQEHHAAEVRHGGMHGGDSCVGHHDLIVPLGCDSCERHHVQGEHRPCRHVLPPLLLPPLGCHQRALWVTSTLQAALGAAPSYLQTGDSTTSYYYCYHHPRADVPGEYQKVILELQEYATKL
jgi:hypothetical protein